MAIKFQFFVFYFCFSVTSFCSNLSTLFSVDVKDLWSIIGVAGYVVLKFIKWFVKWFSCEIKKRDVPCRFVSRFRKWILSKIGKNDDRDIRVVYTVIVAREYNDGRPYRNRSYMRRRFVRVNKSLRKKVIFICFIRSGILAGRVFGRVDII